MIPGMGPMELFLLAVVAVVLFGSKLPDVARNFGQGYNQFRQGLNDLRSSIKTSIPKVDLDVMPRNEKIRHYSDVDDKKPVVKDSDSEQDSDVPLFAPPKSEVKSDES